MPLAQVVGQERKLLHSVDIPAKMVGFEREWRSVFDRDVARGLAKLYVVFKLNFLTLILLSMIYPMLFAAASLHHKSPDFGTAHAKRASQPTHYPIYPILE